MRLGGPTVALLANDSVSGNTGGGLLGDIPNMPAGAMAAPRLLSNQSLPRPLQRSVYGSSPGLTLGLPNMLDGGGQQQQQQQQQQQRGGDIRPSDSEQQQANQSMSGVTAAAGKGSKNARGGGGGGGDEEYESRSGSDNMDGSGEDQDNEPPRKKRYHRHTPHQIQEMEALFKECPHPDDKQRQELSRELGLEPRQVKFWFQNRRTQLKAQQERAENSMLRAEIEKLRAENVTMREAIKNASCPNCGGPATLGEMSFDEQQLRIDNARLKDELERVSTLAAKYLGRPIPHLSGSQGGPSSSLDLAVGGNFGGGGVVHQSQGSSMVSAGSDSVPLMMRPGGVTESEKPVIVDLAVTAMEEFFRLCQPDEPSWIPSPDGPKEVLNYDEYIRQYQSALGPRPYGMRTEATRESDLVMMNGANLVELLMDSSKWVDIFPSIVSRAVTLDVLSAGVTGNRNGALQLMYAELQVLSPLVPTREIYFVRYCKQHADGVWGVVDVSVDGLRDTTPSTNRCRRRPSGFLIQDTPNGYSKVTVLEHVEYDDRSVNRIYKSYVNSGLAFGAQRWLLTLQRQCERLASLLATSISGRDLGVIPNASGRRSMLKLAQRMTNNFCAGVSASTVHTWTTLSGSGEDDVRVMTRKSVDNPGEPHGIVLSAATSLWLPLPPKRVFEFLRDERLRNEWDILSNGGMVQEMAHIAKGQDPGNSVSLLRVNTMNSSHNNMLILQESCTDESGSLVVYAPVDIPAMNLVMQGGDPAYVALLPSGFAILPDGQDYCGIQADGLDVDRPRTPGCLLTVAFQILVSNVPSAKLSLESVATVNNLISCTVQKIKSALQCDNP